MPGGQRTLLAKPVSRSEYGSVKVELSRNRSLMDWIRLASGKILAKKQMSVDHIELVKHNRREDCWVHIFGQVYDVTSYLEFHPGGVPELMRVAGSDATGLFNHYHPWVNYQGMLNSCLVGRFVGDLSMLPQPGPSTIIPPQSISMQLNSLAVNEKHVGEDYGICVVTHDNTITLTSKNWNSSSLFLGNILVDLSQSNKHFRVVIRAKEHSVVEVKWNDVPLDLLSKTYKVAVKDNSITVIFESVIEPLLSSANQSIKQSPLLAYYKCIIEEKRSVSHNTLLFKLRLPEGLFFPVTVGNHVSVKVQKEASILYRSYTPVNPGSLSEEAEFEGNGRYNGCVTISLMIKIYSDGICTPCLEKLNVGDSIEISEPIGNADLSTWANQEYDLLFLAAGTGLTPMVNMLISRLRKIKRNPSVLCNTRLLLFNKTEQDIVNDDWLPMKWNDSKVKVEHILSSPSEGWNGRIGRISDCMIPPVKASLRILLCGPEGFNQNAIKILTVSGHEHDHIHVFDG